MIKKTLLGINIFLGLGLSYSFASYPAIGTTEQMDSENNCKINSDLSINCDISNNVLARQWNNGNRKTLNGIFRTDGGIGVFHNQYINNVLDTGNTRQGILKGNFNICSGNVISAINQNKSFFPNCIPGFTNISLSYDNLINKLQSKTPLYWWNSQEYAGVSLGLLYEDFYFTIMVDGYGSFSNLNGNYSGFNFGLGNSIEYNNINRNNYNVRYRPNGKYKPINTNTNNNYICPTIKQLMQNMGSNYNTGLCYNNTTYFNGTEFEQVEKQDIFTIFNNNYENYINRISIYRNNCTNANTIQACQNAFSGEYKKYSIINNAINSNVDEKKLRNYCNLGLNYDPNATTCVTSGGGIKEPYTNEEIMNDFINKTTIPTPTSGTNSVFDTINNCEDGNRECYINNRNFFESLTQIYQKIIGIFREREGVQGIIPPYIMRITYITLLFTVILKK